MSAAVLAGSNAVAQAADHRMRPPVYPPALLAKNIGGQVILRVQRNAQGRPRDVQVERSSGHPEQDQQHPRVAGKPDRLP
ncbi:TonB family protein [Stenotrophomonas sp. W1S232]|uniref:TonB family protein n=1 Tax=Stenotrophomonas koreensis TaxID=266128 RepID=A0A7W3V293_9GAMM|nr:TonB family protein [Stenotrophomonas koreensis]MBB1118168.1 TonB family protein [Stenotrophomonas koreensis]